MIEFLTSPLSESAAARPALLWILGITLLAIVSVLLRDGWRWFIALGQADETALEAESDPAEMEMVAKTDSAPIVVGVAFDRRNSANTPTGFGRRRTDQIGLAQSA